MRLLIAQTSRMAAVQTTIKTELCSFSEYRIYPGRGQKFVSRDGKVHTYIHSKEARLGRQKLKAAKLRWTLVGLRAVASNCCMHFAVAVAAFSAS